MPLEAWAILAVGLPIVAGVLYWLIKDKGKLEADNARLEEENHVSQAEKDALANAPRNDVDVVERLRRGDF